MGAPSSVLSPTTPQIQQVQGLANLYANAAESLSDQVFGQIPFAMNGQGSVPIPTGFLLQDVICHIHLPVTLGLNGEAAPTLSFLGVLAALEQITLNYNGSQSTIWSTDPIFAAQRLAMEYPSSNFPAAWSVPTPTGVGTNYTYDAYLEVPAIYSLATLMGVLNENSNTVHSSMSARFGNPANMFSLLAGQTATVNGGYIEFIAKRVTAPQNPATDGVPDLTKNYVVTYQDFPLNSSGKNILNLDASDTITRITINLLEGGTGNGSDVASYDSTNALQLTNIKLGWGTNITKFDSPYWYFQQEMARWYGSSMSLWLNRGTVVIDLDKTSGRDWIDAENVTNLALSLTLGAAPPAGSKARVTIESIVNTGVVPIR